MPPQRLILATILFACAPALAQIPDDLTEPGQLPPSTGFADPDDISILLDYRLPDWWSRTWTADLALNGGARTNEGFSSRAVDNTFHLRLATAAGWRFDGERTQASFGADLAGSGDKFRQGGTATDQLGRDYQVASSVNGWWRRYVSNRWAVILGGDGSWSYAERVREVVDEETGDLTRRYTAHARAGFGYGRVRDVTPAIRAARLNERLTALGRAPLATAEVRRVAEAMSQQAVYTDVFDRPDRRFWADVLTPVTDRHDLSPYETLYLAEVLQENVGYRAEGWTVDALLRGGYSHDMQPPLDDVETSYFGPEISAHWSHNLSLNHQLSAWGMASARWTESSGTYALGQYSYDSVGARANLNYLWVLANRCLWSTVLTVTRSYNDRERDGANEIQRSLYGQITSDLTMYVEDRLALKPSVSFSYNEWDMLAGESVGRTFTYGLVFSYDLDRTLN